MGSQKKTKPVVKKSNLIASFLGGFVHLEKDKELGIVVIFNPHGRGKGNPAYIGLAKLRELLFDIDQTLKLKGVKHGA